MTLDEWKEYIQAEVNALSYGAPIPAPIGDVASGLMGSPEVVKVGLETWLDGKMRQAAEQGDFDTVDRYQAFHACLASGDCERVKKWTSKGTGGGSQTFTNPTYNGYRVDRCYNFAQQCDKPAADAFCKLQGFSQSTDFKWEYTAPTYMLGNRKVCGDASACGGFSTVTCAK